MMKRIIPSTVKGQVTAPPSKSMMGRALAAAYLTEGKTVITNPSFCDDALAIIGAIRTLGATVQDRTDTVTVEGGPRQSSVAEGLMLHCGESALCMRVFAPIAALREQPVTLAAGGSLQSRPMEMIEAIRVLGVSCKTENGHAPISLKGPMKGGFIGIDASVSSQFLTGLLLSLPLCQADSKISAYDLKSLPYVRMTIELLKHFGIVVSHDEEFEEFEIPGNQAYIPVPYEVEGDWSGAAFLLVAGALSGPVTVVGLDTESAQADRAIIEVLQRAGAHVELGKDRVAVQRDELKSFRFDVTDCPDLFPPLAALAVHCEGRTIIDGIERLRHKESNRLAALGLELEKLGGSIQSTASSVEIDGGGIRGGVVDAHGDHRVAMACAIAALAAEHEVAITDHACVAKSYPSFFQDLEILQVVP
jgi:3-phosphoshikimate 1-carboxyvinyltransferase